ncbi:MAG: signal peptide peptidase SppA [Desulfobacterales bacterium]|nr:signal peptide peptidase SppA [Desulfobacterales bacterium]
MFSRRHPYLFFLLVFAGIIAGASVVISVISFVSRDKGDLAFGEKVGVIRVEGPILESEPILDSLQKFGRADGIKAIVVRIDSPGGAVGASQEIYRQIRKTAENKPVIASMGNIAASGGYYIASATDGIIAAPGTVTGSIGVIMEYTNFRKLLEKIGVYPVVITSGKYKDMGSPLRKMTEDERRLLQNFVDTVHRQFIEDVAKGRKMKIKPVEEIADGRIMSGQTAKEHGLVDRMGNLTDAVNWAADKGGIRGEPKTVYLPKEKLPLVDYFMDRTSSELQKWLGRARTGELSGGYIYDPGARR